jgi:hypothetical protein
MTLLGVWLWLNFHPNPTQSVLGDHYISFELFHLTVPFSAPYQPFWTGLGTIGLYLNVTFGFI